ncbi:Fruiting body protein [Sparassis crispa]|uniref:Hydrophobin n=1 Tax=Sparassis crispa TaxID=139825 RepID=A0A401GGZ5_9APHY|nr:Fruiting body protein [Sparassis crispa]GBE81466.1 Fruiting body protein [Sparassis crispa]
MFPNFVVLALAILPVALAAPQSGSGSTPCNEGGSVQCCDVIAPAYTKNMSIVLEALQIVVESLSTPVGTGCSPPTPYYVGGGSVCTSDPVCCVNNYFGSVGVGCEPVPTPDGLY